MAAPSSSGRRAVRARSPPRVQPITIAILSFATFVLAGLFGLWLRPDKTHETDGSRDAIRLVQTLLTSMTAAAIGLLLASSSGRFREQEATVATLASKVAVLDLLLKEYGPQTTPVREALRHKTEAARDDIRGSTRGSVKADLPLIEALLLLAPKDDQQRYLHAQIMRYAMEITEGRAALMTRENTYGIQPAMILVLVGWLVVLFFASGLYAPANRMMIAAMVVGALAFASALLMVLEQDRPFHGLLPVTTAPLDEALKVMESR